MLEDVWTGTLQNVTACNGSQTRIGDSWLGCLQYTSNTHYSAGGSGSTYWMIHANHDPSFDRIRNSGPPGVSEKVVDPSLGHQGLFKVYREPYLYTPTSTKYRIHYIVNNSQYTKPGGAKIPFLSVGAQNGRGNSGPVGTINRNLSTTIKDRVRFNFEIIDLSYPEPLRSWTGVFFMSSWGGVKRMVQVPFFGNGDTAPDVYPQSIAEQGVPLTDYLRGNWNWPIYESIFYPGAEVAILPVGFSGVQSCNLGIPEITLIGTPWPFDFDVSKVFKCASDLGLFSTPMPSGNLPLDGIHFYTESEGATGYSWAAVDAVQISN